MTRRLDSNLKPVDEWIELIPWGVTAGTSKSRPVMIFRERDGEATLPVWMSPLDAGIAITQHHGKTAALSPHDLTLNVMNELGVKLVNCFFMRISGYNQTVELEFSGSRKLKRIESRADHALSFCLHARAKFYCTRGYLNECRDVSADVEKAELGMAVMAEDFHNPHPYLN